MKKILVPMCIVVVVCIVWVLTCSKQKSIYTYSIDKNEVTITGLTEYGKTLNQLAIPNKIKENKVTKIGENAFEYCNNVQNVEIPSSIQLIDTGAFYSCENLEYVHVCGSVNIGDMAFANCESLIEFEPEEEIKNIGFQCFCNNDLANLDRILENTDRVDKSSFMWSNKITNIVIPDNIEIIPQKAFAYCNELKEVTISESVKEIGEEAFTNKENSVKIITTKGSVAEQYAIDHNIPYETRDDL